jgi:hypothetical protein
MKFIEISRDIILWNNPFNHFFHKYLSKSIVLFDYTKPFKIYFESPLFENTVVEILFAFDIARSVALGSEGGKEYSLIWISRYRRQT